METSIIEHAGGVISYNTKLSEMLHEFNFYRGKGFDEFSFKYRISLIFTIIYWIFISIIIVWIYYKVKKK